MMAQKDFFYFVEVFLARLLNRSCSLLNSGYLLTAKRIDTSSKTAATMRVFFWLKIAGKAAKSAASTKRANAPDGDIISNPTNNKIAANHASALADSFFI